MSVQPETPVVIFLGGPNDGFIEIGESASFFTMNFDPPNAQGQAQASPAEVGKRIRIIMPKYLHDAGGKIGVENAIALLAKYGKKVETDAVYELAYIDAHEFVFKYVGTYAEVFPDPA